MGVHSKSNRGITTIGSFILSIQIYWKNKNIIKIIKNTHARAIQNTPSHGYAISITLQMLRNMIIQITRSYASDVCVSSTVLRVLAVKEGSLLSKFEVGIYT